MTNPGTLFRLDAVESKRMQWIGNVRVSTSRALRLSAIVSTTVFLAIVLVFAFVELPRKTRVVGRIMPTTGVLDVVAPFSGSVHALNVHQGEEVSAGTIVAVIQTPQLIDGSSTLHARIGDSIVLRGQAIDSISKARLASAAAEIDGLDDEIAYLTIEQKLIRHEIESSQQLTKDHHALMARLAELKAKQFISDFQLQQQRAALADSDRSTSELKRESARLNRERNRLLQQKELRRREMDVLVADRDAQAATLQRETAVNDAQSEASLSVRVDGQIAAIEKREGDAVRAGETIARVLPTGELQAWLTVPSRALGFISPGDAVILRFDAYPYEKFGSMRGTVQDIVGLPMLGDEVTGLQDEPGGDGFRVTVRLSQQNFNVRGVPRTLVAGMRLEADIVGESRTMLEWALEPVLSLR